MPRIGFLTSKDGYYKGGILTLTLSLRISVIPNPELGEPSLPADAPDFIVYCKGVEIGGAWTRYAESGEYLALYMDDPFWPASIEAAAFRNRLDSSRLDIVWTRRPARSGHRSSDAVLGLPSKSDQEPPCRP